MVGAIKSLFSKYTKVFVLVLCLCGIVFLLRFCWHEKYVSWYAPGPIQVLGNNDELWLFSELSRYIHRSRRVPYWDVPSTYRVGGFQEIIILTKNGLQKRIHIAKRDNKDGVTFHPNISKIFAYDGQIYLYSPEGGGYKESLFQFNEKDKRFDLLPIEDGNMILDKILSGTSFIDRLREIEQFSEAGGLRSYYRDGYIGDDSLTWKGIRFEISALNVNDDYFRVIINTVKPNKGYPIVLDYCKDVRWLTYKDYENIEVEHGHPLETK